MCGCVAQILELVVLARLAPNRVAWKIPHARAQLTARRPRPTFVARAGADVAHLRPSVWLLRGRVGLGHAATTSSTRIFCGFAFAAASARRSSRCTTSTVASVKAFVVGAEHDRLALMATGLGAPRRRSPTGWGHLKSKSRRRASGTAHAGGSSSARDGGAWSSLRGHGHAMPVRARHGTPSATCGRRDDVGQGAAVGVGRWLGWKRALAPRVARGSIHAPRRAGWCRARTGSRVRRSTRMGWAIEGGRKKLWCSRLGRGHGHLPIAQLSRPRRAERPAWRGDTLTAGASARLAPLESQGAVRVGRPAPARARRARPRGPIGRGVRRAGSRRGGDCGGAEATFGFAAMSGWPCSTSVIGATSPHAVTYVLVAAPRRQGSSSREQFAIAGRRAPPRATGTWRPPSPRSRGARKAAVAGEWRSPARSAGGPLWGCPPPRALAAMWSAAQLDRDARGCRTPPRAAPPGGGARRAARRRDVASSARVRLGERVPRKRCRRQTVAVPPISPPPLRLGRNVEPRTEPSVGAPPVTRASFWPPARAGRRRGERVWGGPAPASGHINGSRARRDVPVRGVRRVGPALTGRSDGARTTPPGAGGLPLPVRAARFAEAPGASPFASCGAGRQRPLTSGASNTSAGQPGTSASSRDATRSIAQRRHDRSPHIPVPPGR